MTVDFTDCILGWSAGLLEPKLTDTATIQNPGGTSDGQGGQTGSWTTTATGVVCLLTVAGRNAPDEMVVAAQVQAKTLYAINFLLAQAITASQRIVINSRTFEIIGIVYLESLGLQKIAYCVEVH